MAFTKFYGVMTTAISLKNDRLDYYVNLVLQAQKEIAETHYQLGRYSEAADCFSRLLKQDNASIDKAQLLFKLVRCQAAIRRYADAVASAQDYLLRFPNGPEKPEVRFHLATSLKELGRNNESLQQVFKLLQEQREETRGRPEVWAYWQQRTGNLIANQLYREGDYPKALEVYLSLAQLDASPSWQVPVLYQVGMTYERLLQPEKAGETYSTILQREQAAGTNVSLGLKAVFDMARWRKDFIQWQSKAEAANRQIRAENEASIRTASRSGNPLVNP
jgi:tetratricopeptide (TPR) repeat protein